MRLWTERRYYAHSALIGRNCVALCGTLFLCSRNPAPKAKRTR
ncbi:DUF3039 domain-containing protein [Ruegeria discodermiae]